MPQRQWKNPNYYYTILEQDSTTWGGVRCRLQMARILKTV